MYQAIVFLPLLGCIVAAIISLVGARQRHPGLGPGHGDHGHGGHDHHHAPAAAHAAHDAHDDHAAHGHHAAEPAAAGSRAAELVTTLFLFVAMLLSWLAFYRVGLNHQDAREVLLT